MVTPKMVAEFFSSKFGFWSKRRGVFTNKFVGNNWGTLLPPHRIHMVLGENAVGLCIKIDCFMPNSVANRWFVGLSRSNCDKSAKAVSIPNSVCGKVGLAAHFWLVRASSGSWGSGSSSFGGSCMRVWPEAERWYRWFDLGPDLIKYVEILNSHFCRSE